MEAPTKERPNRTRQPIAARQPKLLHFNLQASLQAAVSSNTDHHRNWRAPACSLYHHTTAHAQLSLPPVLNSRPTALLRSPTYFISPEPTKAPGASPPFTDVSGPAPGPELNSPILHLTNLSPNASQSAYRGGRAPPSSDAARNRETHTSSEHSLPPQSRRRLPFPRPPLSR